MKRDVRDTDLFSEALALYEGIHRPGTGQITDAAEVTVSSDGRRAVFAGTLFDALEGAPPTRICLTDLSTGATRVLTFGPNIDRLPKFSPDGRQIAFLSDRRKAGDFQLYLLDPLTGAASATQPVEGWVEYFHWSPDGRRILLGVAGHGADISGGQGAVKSAEAIEVVPPWIPIVETGAEAYRWRSAWIYDLATLQVHPVRTPDINLWEVVWCGNGALAAVVSPGPGEGLWYNARLALIDIDSGGWRELFTPRDQLGWPAASPSGDFVVVVEALCSDRWIVAGDLRMIDRSSGKVRPIDTRGIDVAYAEWRSDSKLLIAGHRGFDTIVGRYDAASDAFREVWRSSDLSTGGRYVTVSGFAEAGDCALIGESFDRSPEIAVIERGTYRTVKSFDLGYSHHAVAIDKIERSVWAAADGLEIQGWLLRPKGQPPYPLVLEIHGGPVWHWRPRWLGRSSLHLLMLLKRGIAIFLPNPRGSGGRGQDFARRVLGDLGGAETDDHLAGIDDLVTRGLADPKRLGVMGVSHGGFMTSWLITQDPRFAAAIPVAPVTNHVTQHLISNIPRFVSLFLADSYTRPGGKYFERSPVMHAQKVKTPTLNICGALDQCTPPEEAVQFHNALMENGVRSVLVTYPQEGHGVRKWPAVLDYAARVVVWFEQYLAAEA
jgi:dipeptidyl aminopeptidase/acylaminoacyl peptidase